MERPIGATPWTSSPSTLRSDLLERHPKVAREETTRERRLRSDTTRSLAKKRPGSDLSQGRAEVALRLFVWPNSYFLKGLLVISLCMFLLFKTYVLSTFGSHQAKGALFWRRTSKTSFDSDFIAFILCSCWFLIYFSTWLLYRKSLLLAPLLFKGQLYIHLYVCMYVYAYTHICIYIYTCIYL